MKIVFINILLVSTVLLISGCGESFGSGNNEIRSSSYQDAPTYQQWQNIEALNCFIMFFESLANGCSSGGDIRFSDPYGWPESRMYGRYGL